MHTCSVNNELKRDLDSLERLARDWGHNFNRLAYSDTLLRETTSNSVTLATASHNMAKKAVTMSRKVAELDHIRDLQNGADKRWGVADD